MRLAMRGVSRVGNAQVSQSSLSVTDAPGPREGRSMKGALVACKEPSNAADGRSVEYPRGVLSDLKAALLILLSLSAGSWELMPRDGVGLKTLPFSSALAMSS